MSDERTFGERFLDEWKRLGGPLSAWKYAELQELRACDREGLVRALRKHQPLLSYAALQRIRTAESPEVLARDTWTQAQLVSVSQATTTTLWMLLALLR